MPRETTASDMEAIGRKEAAQTRLPPVFERVMRRLALMDCLPDHGPQLGRVGVLMGRDGVLHRRLDELVLCIGENGDRAAPIAWNLTAINVLAHGILP